MPSLIDWISLWDVYDTLINTALQNHSTWVKLFLLDSTLSWASLKYINHNCKEALSMLNGKI